MSDNVIAEPEEVKPFFDETAFAIALQDLNRTEGDSTEDRDEDLNSTGRELTNCQSDDRQPAVIIATKDYGPWVERGIWIFLATVSFAISLFLISRVWVKWNTEPDIISWRERTHVASIPFPAVTICSETKVARSLFNFTDYYINHDAYNLTHDQMLLGEAVSVLCKRNLKTNADDTSDYLNETHLDYLKELTPLKENSLRICKFNHTGASPCINNKRYNNNNNNQQFIDYIMTDEGICFTWNMLNYAEFYTGEGLNSKYLQKLPKSKDWNIEKGYADDLFWRTDYPQRNLQSGRKSGIILTISVPTEDLDDICAGSGFKVFLHNPMETISSSMDNFYVPLNTEVEIGIKPEKEMSDSSLRRIPLAKRQCYFPDEYKLAYYKFYTQQNCQLECLTNFTLNQCNCTSYYMPRPSNTSICGLRKSLYCAGDIYEGLQERDEINKFTNDKRFPSSCNCLPACTSVRYQGKVKAKRIFEWKRKIPLVNRTNMNIFRSRIRLYYEDDHFVTTHHREFYGYLNFLADCGGLLALCCGFSFLSLARILYLLVLRHYRKKTWELEKPIAGRYNDSSVHEYRHVPPENTRLGNCRSCHQKNVLKSTFLNYCKIASLPVIKYTVEKERPWVERGWWIFITIIGFIGSAYYIFQVVIKWNHSPIIFSPGNKPVYIHEVPFPAITICSRTKISRTEFDFDDILGKVNSSALTEKEKIKIKPACLACMLWDPRLDKTINDHRNIYEADVEILGKLSELFEFRSKLSNAVLNDFKPILTMNGLCYTRNMLRRDDLFDGDGLRSMYLKDSPVSNWTLEEGYKYNGEKGGDPNEDKIYPKRHLHVGRENGLKIVLVTTDSHLNPECKGTGYEVYFHNPAEVITSSTTNYKVSLDTELDVALKLDKMTTRSPLFKYSPEHRQCYLPHEKKLSYYKVYTQHNCEMECVIRETVARCLCAAYYMPRSSSTPICGIKDMNCVKSAAGLIYRNQNQNSSKTLEGRGKLCNCLAPCTSLQYETETYLNKIEGQGESGLHKTVINVFYKKEAFIPIERNGMYDIIEFLGDCGGYLGLFSGCSLLAILEMIYHATVRLYYNWKQTKTNVQIPL